MKADLHIHSHHSPCSDSKVKSILEKSQREGLNTISITDHDTIRGSLEAREVNPYPDLNIIIGCEKKCEYGELLIYGLKEEIKGMKFVSIIKQAREQGAKVFIAHPQDFFRFPNMWKKLNEEILGSVDGVEVFNGRNVFNNLTKKLASKKNLKGVAGSDSHFVEEIGSTYVVYEEDLWKEVGDKSVKFHHDNPLFKKWKYLIKSLFVKWL